MNTKKHRFQYESFFDDLDAYEKLIHPEMNGVALKADRFITMLKMLKVLRAFLSSDTGCELSIEQLAKEYYACQPATQD